MKYWPKLIPTRTIATPPKDVVFGAPVLDETAPVAQSGVQEPARQRNGSDRSLLDSVLSRTGTVAARARQKRSGDSDIAWTLPGFGGKCRVSTIFGELPIEALRRRDKVKTQSGAYREVQWVDQIKLDEDFMERHPGAHPIMVAARAFGGLQPTKNMLISPGQHLGSPQMIGEHKPVTIADIEGRPNILRMRQQRFTYYRFHCGEPETVMIEGAWFKVAP